MRRYLLLGTAGHIDHGKTSLIRALTGVDTDRLPEEKRRGITVDLGFAALQLDELLLGIIDVPGHERFVKNMLAGAMGIDLALLVVAADEGVMPQTREHFEALSYLNLAAGVIAITKCDLVDEEMLALVSEDVADLVAGSFLQDANMVHVSAKTEFGLDELRDQLKAAAVHVPAQAIDAPFKLSIDRCFSAPGQGTVITGSVANGRVSIGNTLQVLPQNETVTVRNIQSHGESCDSVGKGQRAAINLSGIHFSKLQRGDTLANPGSLVPSRLLSVQFTASQFSTRPLKAQTGVRFYNGATETPGRLRLLETDTLSAGESQLAQVELDNEVCTTWGEPFVVRGLSANEVLGGGQILDPRAYRLSRRDSAKLAALRELPHQDAATRAAALIMLMGGRAWSVDDLWQRAGISNGAALLSKLVADGVLCQFDVKGHPRLLHSNTVRQLSERLLQAVQREHETDRLSPAIPLGRVKQHFQMVEPAELVVLLARHLAEQGRLRLDGDFAALPDWQPQLSANQKTLLAELVSVCEQGQFAPPTVSELASKNDKSPEEIESLLNVAIGTGELIRLPDKDTRDAKAAQRARLYLHPSAAQSLVERVSEEFSESDQWTISQFAELLGLSRKYAIPLCMYLDQTGITKREGDIRVLNSSTAVKS